MLQYVKAYQSMEERVARWDIEHNGYELLTKISGAKVGILATPIINYIILGKLPYL